MRLRAVLASLAAVAALGACWPAPAGAGNAASLPWVTVSPLDGTPDASPDTQISFLGVPAADISQVSLRGSRSGGHGCKLEPYATGTGVSCLPLRPFTAGEQVVVTAVETSGDARRTVGTSFTVATLYVLPPPPPLTPTAAAPGLLQSFVSLPQLHPPTVTVTTPAADSAAGDVSLTPKDGASQPGRWSSPRPASWCWFAPSPPNLEAADLRVQQYLGPTVLTYWQGAAIDLNHGCQQGPDRQHRPTRRSRPCTRATGSRWTCTISTLAPGGITWITIYRAVYADLSSGRRIGRTASSTTASSRRSTCGPGS